MSSNADTYDEPNSSNVDGADASTTRPGVRPGGPADGQDGSLAAIRLLEMTARDTDRWRSEARTEAAALVAEAREESAELVRVARDEAARTLTSAREEADRTTATARDEASQVQEESAALRKRHDEDVKHLEQMALDHKTRLRAHLTEMLAQVDTATPDSNE